MSWNRDDPHRYEDIIHLPHHVSETHPPMSRLDRAAQFAPFAALTGLEEAMGETARLTEQRPELSEGAAAELDAALRRAMERRQQHPALSVTYFQPDERKPGGAILTRRGELDTVDTLRGELRLTDRTRIPLRDILSLREIE